MMQTFFNAYPVKLHCDLKIFAAIFYLFNRTLAKFNMFYPFALRVWQMIRFLYGKCFAEGGAAGAVFEAYALGFTPNVLTPLPCRFPAVLPKPEAVAPPPDATPHPVVMPPERPHERLADEPWTPEPAPPQPNEAASPKPLSEEEADGLPPHDLPAAR